MCVAEVRGVIVGVVWDTCGTVVLFKRRMWRERESVFLCYCGD